jgi:diacylglycerol kinase family enzyme
VWWMPEARMDDGMLDLSALRPLSPVPAWYLLMRSSNREFRSDKIIRVPSRTFNIHLYEESFVQMDGEVYKYNAGEDLLVSVAEKVLSVRVPSDDPNNVWSR